MTHRLVDAVGRSSYRTLLLLLGALATLVSCGGGVGEGGTGSFSLGPISGFGSVIVNGIRFDDSNASIEDDDGASIDRNVLRLGMITAVDAGPVSAGAATASRVRLRSEMVGPASSIDATLKTLQVLGLPVNAATAVIDADSLPTGLAGLQTGDVVEVHGFFSVQSQAYVATRIERKSTTPARFRLRGVVTGRIDDKQFTIGSQTFDLGSLSLTSPAVGTAVRLELATVQVAGVWQVLALQQTGVQAIPEGSRVEVEGLVTRFDSPERFNVEGVEVSVTPSTVFDAGGPVALGVRVEVEGSLANGLLVATRIEFEDEDEVEDREQELRGPLQSVDKPSKTFVVRNQLFDYAAMPSNGFKNGDEDDLVVGREVDAKGMLSADGTRVLATEIEFR